MAYFVVIGTCNEMQSVVDEIKETHLQHNVVTSGCIHVKEDSLYYKWDVYNQSGDKTSEDDGSKSNLTALLTNQIAQFRALLPDGVQVQVFLVGQCNTQEQYDLLRLVCRDLFLIDGTTLSNVSVDIVLVGYDPIKSGDVTTRPSWKTLKTTLDIGVNSHFVTKVLYLNNMDYQGAATNVDVHLLSRFICLWSKMVCAGGAQQSMNDKTYCIGLAEYQYNFEDLADFFKLDAEKRILERTLNDSPSAPTEEMCKFGNYRAIDLDKPWIDGLNTIKDRWNEYCSTEYDYAKTSADHPDVLIAQEKRIAEYLNGYLRIYVAQCEAEKEEQELLLDNLLAEISFINNELALLENAHDIESESEGQASSQSQIDALKVEKGKKEQEVNRCRAKISELEHSIRANSYQDTSDIYRTNNPGNIVNLQDKENYESAKGNEQVLISYLNAQDQAVTAARSAIEHAQAETIFPKYPAKDIENVGILPDHQNPIISRNDDDGGNVGVEGIPTPESERPGCLGKILSIFSKKSETGGILVDSKDSNVQESNGTVSLPVERQRDETTKVNRAFQALQKIQAAKAWWQTLNNMVEKKANRVQECHLLMDGEMDFNGNYRHGKEGYRVKHNPKSVSMIDLDRVRMFRDNDPYYLRMISLTKEKWFDASTPTEKRQTMPELIKHQVIDAVRGQFHTLHWDGKNPFVDENSILSRLPQIIAETTDRSKFFAEYIHLALHNLNNRVVPLFYFNHPDIVQGPSEFRERYHIRDQALTPRYLPDFVNSLCAVQVIGIPDPKSELSDYKPKREYVYPRELTRNYRQDAIRIIGEASTPKDKARKIYDWMCDTISYDTTLQVHDADTCWNLKQGVCQAYCELFCALAESVGLTVEIVCGKSKDQQGAIPEEGHSWLYVFTDGYEGIFVEPTWGAGAISNGKFVRSSAQDREKWFDADPAWMIFTHFPDEEFWQRLDKPVSQEDFEKLPSHQPDSSRNAILTLMEELTKLNA